MNTKFRISANDTIKAYAYNAGGRLISSIYDSEFTTISQVVNALINKIPHFSGKILNITIVNLDKDINKHITKKVNV